MNKIPEFIPADEVIVYLGTCKSKVNASSNELERFTIKVAAKDVGLEEIARWFKENTIKLKP